MIMRWRGPGSGPLFSCVERRNKDRVAESIRVCAQRPPLEVRTCAPPRSLFCGAIATFDALERQLSCSLLTIRVLELPRELGDSSSRAPRLPRLDPLLKALGKLESALLREAPDHEISASCARPGCEREVTAALRPERGVRPMIGDDAKHER